MPKPKPVIFTDLDGTLLDAGSYSFEMARSALGLIKRLNIPLVICTSKTGAEIVYWRRVLGNRQPFISENGGGIFIPPGYFSFDIPEAIPTEGYLTVKMGVSYERLRDAVVSLRAEGFDISGFGDMTPDEVASLTGLDAEQARLSMLREFDEPIVLRGSPGKLQQLKAAIERRGLGCTSGRLVHIMGAGSGKGVAVRRLIELYEREYGAVVSAAVGDSRNDMDMLMEVDHPFLVKKPDSSYEPVAGGSITMVDGIGPVGWAEAVRLFVQRTGLA